VTDHDADVVVVGSGPGGSTFADAVTAAGSTVILLEKGRNHLIDLEPPHAPKHEFSNDELKFHASHFLGPDPLVEPRTFRRGVDDGDRLLRGDVNNLPSTVGGGGPHADGKLPRFREEDFHLHSERGPIAGATLDDWPLAYDELEPYYAEAERLIGVAGESGNNPFAAWRSTDFPMPPGPDMFGATLSGPASERFGLHPYRAPTGANTVVYDGRPACNNCGFCGEYGCPIHAKGDPVASLRRALTTGRCELRPESVVTTILLDATRRRTTGVAYLDADGERHELRSRHVVLAAGAFETARLLLLNEVGNSSDLVGRNLTYHFQTMVVGGFPFSLHSSRGRSVTHLMDDFLDPSADDLAAAREVDLPWFRGGTVEHGGALGPVLEAKTYPFGPQHNRSMRESALRDRLWVFTMQGEDLPQHTNRVDLDPQVRDVWGQPAGRVTYSPHRHEIAASEHWSPLLEEVMGDAGAEWCITTTSPPARPGPHDHLSPLGIAPASRHVMGTCRMGRDPATSVVDPHGRFHDVENLLCADSSVFVTSTGYNPTLSLVALSLRTAHHLTGTPLPASTPRMA
jgi:gluconate 2-dehydrogenase alpha chain